MKFWYTKFLMRFMALIALLGFVGVMYYALQTESDYEPVGYKAPFHENVDLRNAYYAPGTGAMTLGEPHRSENELKKWITNVASEVLYIPNRQYNRVTAEADEYFTDKGKAEYLSYLEQSKVDQYVNNSNYSLNVLVDGEPLQLNAKKINGVYRWLFQVPIIVSFVPNQTDSVSGKSDESVTQNLNLTLQIRRANVNNDPDAIRVESWKMRKRR